MRFLLTSCLIVAFTMTAIAQKSSPAFTLGVSASYKYKENTSNNLVFSEAVFQPRLHLGLLINERWEAGLFGGSVSYDFGENSSFNEKGFAAGGYGRYNFFVADSGKWKVYVGAAAYYERRSSGTELRFGTQHDGNGGFIPGGEIFMRRYTGDMAIYVHPGVQYSPGNGLGLFAEFGRVGHVYTRRSNSLTDTVVREYNGLNPFDLKGLRVGAQWYLD